jgi:pyridoxine 5'-phosphate synthase PdxJ
MQIQIGKRGNAASVGLEKAVKEMLRLMKNYRG